MSSFIKNWDGYFICPNCNRIHKLSKIKRDLVWCSSAEMFNSSDCTEFKCMYCDELICGLERHGSNGYMYNTKGKIKEYRIFTNTGRLVYIY